jgi:hypothetical protein
VVSYGNYYSHRGIQKEMFGHRDAQSAEKQKMGNKYIDKFLALRCAGDVHNVTFPVQNMAKEISESMGMINHLRSLVLKEPMRYTLLDLCAGNALTGIIGIHLLPIKAAHAFDIKPHTKRNYQDVKRFTYHQQDINANEGPLPDLMRTLAPTDTIIIGVHPCGMLATTIINLAFLYQVEHVAVMPCCQSQIEPWMASVPFLSREEKWLMTLASPHKLHIKVDRHIMSPRRYILHGRAY